MAMAGGAKRLSGESHKQSRSGDPLEPGADVVIGSERIWRQPGSDAPH